LSRVIRAGSVPALAHYGSTAPGASFVDASAAEAASVLFRIREDLGRDDVQIVAPAYSGPSGIDAINRYFHLLNRSSGAATQGGLAAGDPCLWTKNDQHRQLWNGSLGTVLGFLGDKVLAEFNGQSYKIERFDVAKLQLAYCISVHKAQGSQFKHVLIPVFPTRNLDRCMIYTALTRATEKVVFVGDIGVLNAAVRGGSPSLRRDVGFRLRW
jgi:exodeoxyribonuclease V alpha subunit